MVSVRRAVHRLASENEVGFFRRTATEKFKTNRHILLRQSQGWGGAPPPVLTQQMTLNVPPCTSSGVDGHRSSPPSHIIYANPVVDFPSVHGPTFCSPCLRHPNHPPSSSQKRKGEDLSGADDRKIWIDTGLRSAQIRLDSLKTGSCMDRSQDDQKTVSVDERSYTIIHRVLQRG
ncbi:hypothetical protein BDW75DRAFT_39673 [Aspergillus navahoensis]